MWWLIGALLVTFIIATRFYGISRKAKVVGVQKRLVVVTGCDSGIGHALALAARSWGCTVVGTCLATSGKAGDSLRAAGVHVVRLDLTDTNPIEDLKNLLEHLEADGEKLWCLVNNAGMMTFAACEWLTEHLVAQQMQVNLTGSIQLTSALLPKIRRNKGRIVLVSSPTGQVAVPNMSAYSASKWGVEGFAQALRREVQHLGVSVSVVRPCNLPNRTHILRNNASLLREMLENASQETKEDYGKMMEQTQSNFAQGFGKLDDLQEIRDNYLIQCFRSAILSEKPRKVYAAAPLLVRFYLNLAQMIPTRLLDFLVIEGFHDAVINLAYKP